MSRSICILTAAHIDPLVAQAARLLKREIQERSGVRTAPSQKAELRIKLTVQTGIGLEGFRISDGPDGEIHILGNDPRGVLYGVGKFLRTSSYRPRQFLPGTWRGDSVPEKPIRGMYFATHFHNFYHDAPLPKVQRYVEDLALWGCNTLPVWFDMHHYSSMTDPQARTMVKRLHAILATANRVGMQAAFTLLSNEAFANSPQELRADWTSGHDGYFLDPGGHYHLELCPHKPGGLSKILEYRDSMLKAFAGIDIGYFTLWPYDQGGCTCSACTPWGANGHLVTSEAVAKLAKKRFPKAKIILSTWYFDNFIKDEWKAFDQAINRSKPKWIDYLLADNGGSQFPEYILKNGVPGQYPLVTFAELSMHGMFPWGGFGANPQPHHFQAIWNQCQALISGGFPYSEGIFEDINKAIQFQFGWDSHRKATDIIREYAAYEFSPAAADELVRAAELMEGSQNHYTDFTKGGAFYNAKPAARASLPSDFYQLKQPHKTDECLALVKAAEQKMTATARKSWRWRIFAIRSILDAELHHSGGRPTPATERGFQELTRIYSAQKAEVYVTPPGQTGVRRLTQRASWQIKQSSRQSNFVTAWQVSRLFPKDCTTIADAPAVTLSQPANWKTVSVKGYPFVSVHDLHGNSDGLVYLANQFRVPHDGRWTLLLGHDGGVRVFIDGNPVFCEPHRNNPAPLDRSRIPLKLSAGKHEIVIALDTHQGKGWGFFFRFERPASKGAFPKRSP